MLAGELYDANDPTLVAERQRARGLCQRYNVLDPGADDHASAVDALLTQLFGNASGLIVTAPFFCDYGYNVHLGRDVYFNFNCVVLDVLPVDIGDRVLFGPGVHIYTASHPMDVATRREGLEFGRPVVIGDDAWLGGGAIVCPGVTIGDGAVIGAGSVVVHDVPDGVLAAGNPCRVLRGL